MTAVATEYSSVQPSVALKGASVEVSSGAVAVSAAWYFPAETKTVALKSICESLSEYSRPKHPLLVVEMTTVATEYFSPTVRCKACAQG